jgi:hypothetical protein
VEAAFPAGETRSIGGAVGTKTIDPNTAGPGESGRMDRILDAGFKQPAGENVFIQHSTLQVTDPAFAAVIEDVVRRIETLDVVQNVDSPLDPANSGQIAPGGHAALVEFEIRGNSGDAADKIGPVLDRVEVAQEVHPEFFIGEFGEASGEDALIRVRRDKAERVLSRGGSPFTNRVAQERRSLVSELRGAYAPALLDRAQPAGGPIQTDALRRLYHPVHRNLGILPQS